MRWLVSGGTRMCWLSFEEAECAVWLGGKPKCAGWLLKSQKMLGVSNQGVCWLVFEEPGCPSTFFKHQAVVCCLSF